MAWWGPSRIVTTKRTSAVPNCYRDIRLAAIPGECVTKELRFHLLPIAHTLCGISQFCSGRNGGETTFAHIYVWLVSDYCKRYHTSAAFVCLDIVTAFAVLLRRIIFDEFDSDETWLCKLSNFGVPSDDNSCYL